MILCCGEALIDLIPNGPTREPHVGGAVLNTAVALGRLGEEVDLVDQIPIRREYVDPVTTVTCPTCAGPEIAVDIAADAIGHGRTHITEDAAIRQPAVVFHIVDQNLVRMIRFM